MEWITDRTQADVLLGNSKGTYSCGDLNRVEQGVQQLADLAQKLDIHYAPEIKPDWEIPGAFSADQWPVQSQMVRYLENVQKLCLAVEVSMKLPDSMEQLTWEKANQIEQALMAVQTQIQSVLQTFKFSGELSAGEENGI